jgi:hypothetical protein
MRTDLSPTFAPKASGSQNAAAMRWAVLMQVCDSDSEIAPVALSSMVNALRSGETPVEIHLFIIDDASKGRIGDRLSEHARELGVDVTLHSLRQPLGFRGSAARMMTAFSLAAVAGAKSGRGFDFVAKIDPDTLFIRPGLADSIARHAGPRGIWGVTVPTRGRDKLLYLLDLLPAGFRRKQIGNSIGREWSLSRWGPVWWSAAGRRALFRRRNAYRFRFAAGCFYAVGGETVRELAGCGAFDGPAFVRHGFLTSEEDPIVSTLVASVGDPIVDLNALEPAWGHPSVVAETDVNAVVEAGTYMVHPLKANDAGRTLRARFVEAERRRWGDRAPA